MNIQLSRPVTMALKTLGALALVCVIYQERPPMYRYLFKFEAM